MRATLRLLVAFTLLTFAAPARAGTEADETPVLESSEPDGRAPEHRDRPHLSGHPGLRLAVAALWAGYTKRRRAYFALEFVANGRIVFGRALEGVMLMPEIGYTYSRVRPDNHIVAVGMGLGYHHDWFHIGWIPRLALGSAAGSFAVGFRHGVMTGMLMGLVVVEVSHQMLAVEGDLRHDVRLNFGSDIIAWIVLARGLSGARKTKRMFGG